ncbi:hypothetical protein AAFN88_12765 [Pelagibius sp. CAU 1746]|uniref:hypothetical protein n=1 Tax=Pelagibius sp. CAU 1746 TaxID=3140370 RepID=UPI00325C0554
MQTTASQVPASQGVARRRRTAIRPAPAGKVLGLLPFALSDLADLRPEPMLRRSLLRFAMGHSHSGPALSLLWGDKVVACAGLAIGGLQAKAWAFFSAPLCRQTWLSLFRAFARALPRLKRSYGLDSILVEAHPDHVPSREWLERIGFRFDGLSARRPLHGERLLRYVFR